MRRTKTLLISVLSFGLLAACGTTTQTFINKGMNGRWRDVLTAADLERYEAAFRRKVSPACADWLEHGRLGAGDPRAAPD